MNILVICHGNIYRSPFAAEVMIQLEMDGMEIRSRGFVNPGRVAAKKMRIAAAKRDYDLSHHRSVLVTKSDLKWADFILYMDNGNLKRLKAMTNGKTALEAKFIPFGSFADPVVDKIKDPAFLKADSQEFKLIVEQLEEASLSFIDQVTSL